MDTEKLLIVCLLIIPEISPDHDQFCDQVAGPNGVIWNTTNTATFSNPPCLNSAKEFVYRDCHDGQWGDEPVCYKIQPKQPAQCPENFSEAGNLCYIVTAKARYLPTCPFQDVAFFTDYSSIIDDKHLGPVWMPARRDANNGLNYVVWLEASPLYKKEIKVSNVPNSMKDKDCLVYDNGTIVPVSCRKEYPTVCAYYKLNVLENPLCKDLGTCRQADYANKSKCFCADETLEPAAELLHEYQYLAYANLTTDVCAIGLEKVNGTYTWTRSKREIEYTYWSPSVVFDKELVHGAITPTGWILTQSKAEHVLCERIIPIKEPTIVLTYDDTRHVLVVNVTNPRYLKGDTYNAPVYCYSFGVNIFVVSGRSTDTWYVFEYEPQLPGEYWCEAFTLLEVRLVQSLTKFVSSVEYFGWEFAAILRAGYHSGYNPFSSDSINYVNSLLQTYISLPFNYTKRVMKILDVDEDNVQLLVNVHYTIKANVTLAQVRSLFEDGLSYADIQLVDFLSSDYCPAVNDGLTWPQTPKGSATRPKEYCFTPSRDLVTRQCDGTFVDGAKWSNFSKCELAEKSSITDQLLLLVNNPDPRLATYVLEITKNSHKFNQFDVYLVWTIYATSNTTISCDLFMKTINNVLDVDRTVVAQSQIQMKTTDGLLQLINKVLLSSKDNQRYSEDNFVFYSGTSSELSGLILLKENDQFVVRPLTGNYTAVNLTDIRNLEGAIWLSPEMRQHMYDLDQLIVGVYFKDSFFHDTTTTSKNSSTVFSFILSNQRQFYGPILVLHRINKTEPEDCAFWNYSTSDFGRWQKNIIQIDISSFIVCEYWYTGNFGFTIARASQDSVTNTLLNWLNPIETLGPMTGPHPIVDLSGRYSEFKSIDVFLVGAVLQRMSIGDDLDLEDLAKVVSNLHRIDRDVLQMSQMEEGATDTVLHSVDVILQRRKDQSRLEISDDNFLIFIADLNDNDFSGLMVMQSDDAIETTVLDGDVHLSELLHQQNLHCAVFLSPQLKKQIRDETKGTKDAKVIITVFFTDALFNEKNPQPRNISKTFGVILPDIGDYNGPISVIHNASGYNADKCVHWNYNQSSNITGYWKEDRDTQEVSSLVHCDFWHTTHFALLLMDEDKVTDPETFLDVITTINCAISGVGLGCIILTAIFFKRWRSNTSNKILLNFSMAILIQIVVFYVADRVRDPALCTVFGAILHYSILSQFSWMLILAVLQFRRLVQVLVETPRNILLKVSLFGWVLPLLPVLCVLSIDPRNYVSSNVGLCYPSGLGLYLGVWFPVGVTVTANCAIFTCIVYSVAMSKSECSNVGKHDVVLQWRLAFSLFFMLGLTWIFGFLGELNFGEFFVYLFCFTATLQGFFIFLFFFVLNVNTRYMYSQAFKKLFH